MTAPALIEALSDDLRRGLYEALLRHGPRTRKALAIDAGVGVSLVSFHLDKLIAAGLVDAGGPVTTGTRGRPAVLYEAVSREVLVSVPPRRYELAAELLLEATRNADPREGLLPALRHVARARGRQIGAGARSQRSRRGRLRQLLDVLTSAGYEPEAVSREVVFVNCPFDRLRRADTEMICTMNLELARGCIEGLGVEDEFEPRLQPSPTTCCVVVGRAGAAAPPR